MKNLGFITCEKFKTLYHDDHHLIQPLAEVEIAVEVLIWDKHDPNDFDALLFRSAWDYHFKTPEFENWLETLTQIDIPVFNPVSIIKKNYDKFYLKELADSGLPIIRTLFFENVKDIDLKQILKNQGWEKAVIKPAISMSAFKTHLITPENIDTFQKELTTIYEDRKVILQQFAKPIIETGEWSLVFFEKEYAFTVLKSPKKGEFRVQGELGGSIQLVQPSEEVIAQAKQFLDYYEEDILYARVDGIVENGQFRLMELELIDPELYFRIAPKGKERFVKLLQQKLF